MSPFCLLAPGIWGINNAVWIIKDPGCTSGPSPLFAWMKSNKVGFGVWQWWMGDPSPVNRLIDKVRQQAAGSQLSQAGRSTSSY